MMFWYSAVRGQKLTYEENQYFLPFQFLNMKPSSLKEVNKMPYALSVRVYYIKNLTCLAKSEMKTFSCSSQVIGVNVYWGVSSK